MANSQRPPTKQRKSIPVPTQFAGVIERLRRATIDASDFAVPWSLFHDELAIAPGFDLAGECDKNQKLSLVIEKSVQSIDRDCRCEAAMLLHLGDFWHGFVGTSRGPVVVFYFEREDLGLLGFMSRPGGNRLVRFSIVALDAPAMPGAPTRGQA